MHWLTEFPFCPKSFKSLTRPTVDLPKSVRELDYYQYDKVVEGMMALVSQRVGVGGEVAHYPRRKLPNGTSRIYHDENVTWTWEASPGQLMDWSQHLGRMWKYPRIALTNWQSVRRSRSWWSLATDFAIGFCR